LNPRTSRLKSYHYSSTLLINRFITATRSRKIRNLGPKSARPDTIELVAPPLGRTCAQPTITLDNTITISDKESIVISGEKSCDRQLEQHPFFVAILHHCLVVTRDFELIQQVLAQQALAANVSNDKETNLI